jgi:RNA polymerase sigma-70 factor (ECF subfamily)
MTNYHNSSEKDLISKASEGEKEAFEELLLRNKGRVEGWILSFTKQPEVVQDIFQITSLKAWRFLGKFRGDCKFSTWMCNIARNSYYDLYRAKQRRPETSLDALLERQKEEGGAFEFHNCETEEHPRNRDQDSNYYLAEIDKKLDFLSPSHREPLMMFLQGGLEYSEIAKKLDCPVGTVMSRIFYARKKAQRVLVSLKNELITK